MKQILFASTLAALVALAPSITSAQPGPMGGGPCPCGGKGMGPGMHGRGHGPGMGMHPGMGPHGKGPGGPFEMLMKGDLPEFVKTKLGITPQQITQIKNLVQGHVARMEQLQLEKKRVMAQLAVEWLQDRLDETKIRGLHARKLKAKQEMMQKKLELKLGIAKVLTAQQRLKILSHHKPGGARGGGCGR